jgi:ATP-dependent Lon protease
MRQVVDGATHGRTDRLPGSCASQDLPLRLRRRVRGDVQRYSKAWTNSTPSVPTRAIAAAMVANPFVLVDELNRAGSWNHNGNLFDAMVGFCDRETSKRHRETALDCTIDLPA